MTRSSVRPSGKFADELPFLLIGACSAISLPGLPPTVGLPLVIALLVAPLLLLQTPSFRGSAWLLSAGIVSLVAYAVTSDLNGVSPWQRSSVILAANVAGLVAFRLLTGGSVTRLLALIAGHSASSALLTIMKPTALTAVSLEYLWKFGIAVPATVIVLYSLGRSEKRNLLTAPIALGALGLLSMFLNFRSHGLACLLAAAVVLLASISARAEKVSFGRRIGQLFLAIVIILPISQLPAIMESGILGAAVQQKALAQSEGGPAFLAGRTEPAMSFSIIKERPLSGWGSVDEVPVSLVAEGRDLLAKLGVPNTDLIYHGWFRNGPVATLHSILAQTWVEGGLISALFLITLLFCALLTTARYRGIQFALVVYLSLQIIWDTLFSPHTTYTAIMWGMVAALFSVTARKKTLPPPSPNERSHYELRAAD